MGDSLPGADHRPRVAAERRRHTKRALIESALLVIGRRGFDAQSIDEIVETAGVSRRTYYNYFATRRDLTLAIAEEVTNELLGVVAPVVDRYENAADRMATGVRSTLGLVNNRPAIAAFLGRAGYRAVRPGSLAYALLSHDVALGLKDGTFKRRTLDLAMDIALGPILTAMGRMETTRLSRRAIDDIAYAILRAFETPPARAKRAVSLPIPRLRVPKTSLLVHSPALENL